MIEKKKISVIIPAFNSSQTIVGCIKSVFNSQYAVFEVIVVDDFSTDSTCNIVESLMSEYENLNLIKLPANGGPGKARNQGAHIALGEFLFFLDSDTVMMHDTLLYFAHRIDQFDAVTGIYHFEALNSGIAPAYKALLNYYYFSRKGVIPYEVFDSARAGIRKDVFLNLGGYNEELKWGQDFENEEFGYRLCEKYTNCIDPSILVRHEFPNFLEMTSLYFNRVSQWMEIFCQRKKFESGGVTSKTIGFASISLFLFYLTIPFIGTIDGVELISIGVLLFYLYGYSGFFYFVLKKDFSFLPIAISLNNFFTFVIAAGAVYGVGKFLKFKIVSLR